MKCFVSIAGLLLAGSLALTNQAPLAAQTPIPAGIVTLSFNSAVLQTAEAQRELGALRTKYTPREAQLKALNTEVTGLQQQLQAAGDKLSDSERASREQTLANKEKQLQRESEDFKADSQADSQEVVQGVAQRVYAFLQTYAAQHGYSMIVERGSEASPVVWYVAANMDITEALVKAYNAQASTPSTPVPQARPAAAKPPATPQPK